MRNSRDWRPQTLDVESIARDAVLARIEDKLDALLAQSISGQTHHAQQDRCRCNASGTPAKSNG